MARNNTGTREWSDTSINIGAGCPNNCRYCYAAASSNRFGRKLRTDWHNYTPSPKMLRKWLSTTRNDLGVCMFPTQHDINEQNWQDVAKVANHLMEAGNRVLLVTKAGPFAESTVESMFETGDAVLIRERLEVRVTIGSMDDDILRFWEPGAPDYLSRVGFVNFCNERDVRTSVSIEPFLDCSVLALAIAMTGAASGDVWVGMMNRIPTRVNLSAMTRAERDCYVEPLTGFMANDEAMRFMVQNLSKFPQIRWKDSMQDWIDTHLKTGS